MSMRILAFIAGCLAANISSAMELAKYPKAFSAPGGAEVVVAPTVKGDQALLQVKGINHPIDGVVFLSDIVSRGEKVQAYQFKRDGEERALILRQEGWGGQYFEAFLPEQGRVSLSPEEALSKAVNLESLQALYLRQKAEGVQKDIARFDRQGHQQEAKESLAQMDAQANSACSSNVSTRVDWDSISDATLMSVSVSGYCGVVVSELENLCEDNASFKPTAKKINTVSCQFGERLKLDLDGDEVTLITAKDEPNQGSFTRSYFRNL